MSLTLPPIQPSPLALPSLQALVGAGARTILEIGAHDGLDTYRLKDLFPEATLYAFEPDPRVILKFKTRAPEPRVRLFEIAIGAQDGPARFYVSSGIMPDATPWQQKVYHYGWDKSGSIRQPKNHSKFWPWVKFEGSVVVPVRRLDGWAHEQNLGAVDLIWADVQGAEADLIAGGQAVLARTRWFYTEYSNDYWYEGQATLQQILDLLPGFTVHSRFDNEVLLENTALAGEVARRRRFGAGF